MPNMDGTGPMGRGPLTGRGMGRCEGARPRGLGMGWRCRFFGRGIGPQFSRNVELSKEEERKILEAELKEIDAEKEEIQKRLKEL